MGPVMIETAARRTTMANTQSRTQEREAEFQRRLCEANDLESLRALREEWVREKDHVAGQVEYLESVVNPDANRIYQLKVVLRAKGRQILHIEKKISAIKQSLGGSPVKFTKAAQRILDPETFDRVVQAARQLP